MSSRIDKPGAVKFRPGPPGKGRPSGGVPISQPTRPQQSRQAPPSSPSLPPQHQDQQQQRRPSLPPSPSLAPTSPSVRAQGHPSVPIISPSRRPPALGAPIATPSNCREDALSRSSGGVPIRLPSTIPGAPGASPRMRTAPSPSPVPSLPGSSMGGSGSATKTKSYAFVSPASKKVGGGSGGGVPITIGMSGSGPGRDASMGPPLRVPTPRAPSIGPSVGRRSVTPSPRQPSDTPVSAVSSASVQRSEDAGTSKASGGGGSQSEASADDGSSAATPQQKASKEASKGLEAPAESSSKPALTRRSKRTSGKEKELPTKQANGEGNKEQAVSEPEAESDLEDSNAEDEYRPPVKAKRSRRGKNKEVEDVEGATSEPDVASSASQAKVAKRSHNPRKASTPHLAQEPTSTKTGKRKKTSERKTGEPKRPMNAFLLFKRDFSANDREKAHGLTGLTAHQDQMKRASHAWNAMEAADKAKYKVIAEELKRKCDEEVKAFRASQAPDESSASETEGGETSEGGIKSGRKRRSAKRRSKTTTISEDEAEYLADLQKFGPELRGNRIDVNSTTMEDISSASFKRGRIGTRTFHMEKILKQKREERRRELRNEKDRAKAGGNNVKGEEVGHKEEQQAGASKGMAALTSRGYIEGEEEEVIEPSDTEAARPNTGSDRGQDDDDDFDEEEVEEEEGEGGASDAESVGAMSNATASTHHTLRENRFAVQTRIVDGKIVIDDASLQVSLGQDPSMDGVGAEYIDENEREKFVNSASWSKRRGREKWTGEETSQFFKAVSMWGTDFEMISRMFKSRDRASIKKKWRFEEGKNPRMLDAAFARRLPVDLTEYGVLTGVDLSGEAPRIEARNFDPDASMAEDQKRNRSKKEEGDHAEDEEAADEEEIVEEEGGASPTRVIRKKSTTPTRSPGLLRGESQEASLAIEEDDQEDLPALDANASKQKRRSSNASAISVPTRQRSQSISMSTSTTAASGGAGGREKERQEKQQREKLRREKEMARRRPVAADDEDVEIVEE